MRRLHAPPPDRASLLALCENQLRALRDLQALLFEEILAAPDPIPLSLAELAEDVANRLMDVSEAISDRHLAARREASASPEGTASAYPVQG